ncbi:MAG: hypothetical protein JXA89_21670, partial [Anaerolineae bacterium]|nr:hypothetical protein [Anaerolineae bacterium]
MRWNRKPFELTAEHEQTLRALTVDENGPGTIGRDFEALLAFARGRDLPVSQVNQLPPLKLLPQINALLSRPIEVRLKRPQLKSFPHIQGLYLLLRATGLGQVGGTPSKPALVIDPDVYAVWRSLNPAEQYVTLLEAWLLHGLPEIVGERSPLFVSRLFEEHAALFVEAGGDGLPIADNPWAAGFWYDMPGRMGIALMELFGLLSVATRPPQEGEGWVVDAVHRTPLGEAILALLDTVLFGDVHETIELDYAP